ncbi:unnamed protein product [Bursaphelenchus okinawaensis]|uniref:Uncharacterized protein n=1 Tax=Bursaphelenchus okinawaensis TaxID=465554 RepID=A0A811KQ07_9BILA|nr:unnamed protein product [Bursaphelenchus okinawaensis]CAG9110951.1 unnamed protein product [Bursaphelenchus okinawaensis]
MDNLSDRSYASAHSENSLMIDHNSTVPSNASNNTVPQRPKTPETADSGCPKDNRPSFDSLEVSSMDNVFRGISAGSTSTPFSSSRATVPQRLATPRIEEIPEEQEGETVMSYRSDPTTISGTTTCSRRTPVVPRPSPLNTRMLRHLPKIYDSPQSETPLQFHGLTMESPKAMPKSAIYEKVLERQIWQLRDQIQMIDRMRDEYEVFLTESKNSILSELRDQIYDLNSKLNILSQEKIDLTQALAGIRSENANLHQRNKELKSSLEKEKQKDNNELELVKKLLNEKRTQLVESDKRKANLAKEVKTLKENATADNEKMNDLQQKLSKQHLTAQKLREEKVKMQKEMDKLKQDLEQAKSAASRLPLAELPSAQRPTKASAAKAQTKKPAVSKGALKNVTWNPNLEDVHQNDNLDVHIPNEMLWISTGTSEGTTIDTFKSDNGQLVVRQTLADRCKVYKNGGIEEKSFKWTYRDDIQIEIDYQDEERLLLVDIFTIKVYVYKSGLLMVDYGPEGQMYILPDGQRVEVINNQNEFERFELFNQTNVQTYDHNTSTDGPIEYNKKKYSKRAFNDTKVMYLEDKSINFFNKHFECRYSEDKFIRFLSKPHNLLFDLHWRTGRVDIQHWHGHDLPREPCYCNEYPSQRVRQS